MKISQVGLLIHGEKKEKKFACQKKGAQPRPDLLHTTFFFANEKEKLGQYHIEEVTKMCRTSDLLNNGVYEYLLYW